MRYLEISLNGERQLTAGVAGAEKLDVAVAAYPDLGECWLTVRADVLPEGQPAATAEWTPLALALGDTVSIRLVESDAPDAAQLRRFDPTVAASDSIPFACSFCGKSHTAVEGMVAARGASICTDCIRSLYLDLDDRAEV